MTATKKELADALDLLVKNGYCVLTVAAFDRMTKRLADPDRLYEHDPETGEILR